ncbi:MAG: Lrp/AsnC family transcriptional regulator [Desulfococcaceae bacterium]
MLTDLEKKVIAAVQGDIPVVERPFEAIARRIGASEDEVIDTLQSLRDRGVLRRFGATLKHQRSGYKANAMMAWRIPEDRIERVGETVAGFSEVTHCYRRDPAGDWPYNLYSMIHARDEAGCFEIARRMSAAVGETDYKLLFSRRELKKTSMQYFPDMLPGHLEDGSPTP